VGEKLGDVGGGGSFYLDEWIPAAWTNDLETCHVAIADLIGGYVFTQKKRVPKFHFRHLASRDAMGESSK
jgi:hypothetical protein